MLYGNFPLALCFTHGNVYVSVLLSQFVPPFPSPTVSTCLCVCVSIPALQIGSSVPGCLVSIYMLLINDICFFLTYFTLYPLQGSWASPVVQTVKNLPAMREIWVRSLGWDDPLEKGASTHSSILAWRIPWTEDLVGYSPWTHRVGLD